MTSLDEFQSHRPLLFSVAYRMLGSASDAEDVAQDAWLRATGAAPDEPRSVKAWLTTIVSRLCLDRLKSARAKREEYIGPWLPEPVLTSVEGPDAMLQREESMIARLSRAARHAVSPGTRRVPPDSQRSSGELVDLAAEPLQTRVGRPRSIGVACIHARGLMPDPRSRYKCEIADSECAPR